MATIFFSPPPPNQSSSMAVNLCTDICSSPRISFSYILDHLPSSDQVARSDQNLSYNEPDFDFDFRLPVCEFSDEISPADELFSNGVILPIKIKETVPKPKEGDAEEEEGIIVITSSTKASLIREEKGNSRSFWRFMRSSSVNCDNSSHCKKASIWSSLPLLVRSYSTGSKHGVNNLRQSSKPCSSNSGKPPLKKAQLLNVPSPYITKGTSDLLGFRSLFGNGKKV